MAEQYRCPCVETGSDLTRMERERAQPIGAGKGDGEEVKCV